MTTMRTTKSAYLSVFALLLAAATTTNAFSTTPLVSGKMAHQVVTNQQASSSSSSSARWLAKPTKESNDQTGKGVDYVKIAGMFVNPLNPYSWFLYFFVFIYGYNAIANQ